MKMAAACRIAFLENEPIRLNFLAAVSGVNIGISVGVCLACGLAVYIIKRIFNAR